MMRGRAFRGLLKVVEQVELSYPDQILIAAGALVVCACAVSKQA